MPRSGSAFKACPSIPDGVLMRADMGGPGDALFSDGVIKGFALYIKSFLGTDIAKLFKLKEQGLTNLFLYVGGNTAGHNDDSGEYEAGI